MLEDFQKIIRSILYDRIANPLSGTFLFTWCVWNWRIIYVTIFEASDKLRTSRIGYIESLLDWKNVLLYPAATTLFLLTLYPFVSEQAYRTWLYFRHRKFMLKEKMEDKKRLTIEQSIAIRLELKSMEEKYERLNSDKDAQIEFLKEENGKLLSQLSQAQSQPRINSASETDDSMDDVLEFLHKDEELIKLLQDVHLNTRVNFRGERWLPKLKALKALELQGVLEQKEEKGIVFYYVTERGKRVLLKLMQKNTVASNKKTS